MLYRVPLVLEPQSEGGFTVTSPTLPELVTEGDTIDEAYANAHEALATVIELYEDQGRSLPKDIRLPGEGQPIRFEALVEGT